MAEMLSPGVNNRITGLTMRLLIVILKENSLNCWEPKLK